MYGKKNGEILKRKKYRKKTNLKRRKEKVSCTLKPFTADQLMDKGKGNRKKMAQVRQKC